MIYSLEAQVSQMTSAMADVKTAVESAESSMLSSIVSGTALGTALEAMGVKALEAFQSAAEAIPDFVEQTIDLGNSIYEMSMKTGASVENLSALRYVAVQSGMDFDTLTQSFFKMEVALGATGPKADTLSLALENVGLNLQTLKNESPDEAFIQLVSALENVGNAADRNALAMQLFGKGAKNMAGLFHEDIYAMMDDAASLGLIITTEDAAAAHAADVGWKSFTMQLEAAGMQMADSVLPALVAIEGLLSNAFQAAVQNTTLKFTDMNSIVKTVLDTVLKFGEGAVDVARAVYDGFVLVSPVFELLAKAVLSFTNDALGNLKDIALLGSMLPGTAGKDFGNLALAINGLQIGLQKGADGAATFTTALHTGQPAADAMFTGLKNGIETVRTGLPAAFDTAAAKIADFAAKSHAAGQSTDSDVTTMSAGMKAFQKAVDEVNSAGIGWQGTLDTIDGAVVENMRDLTAAGVSIKTLEEYYGLTATQGKAFTDMLKAESAELKLDQGIEAESAKLWDQYFKAVDAGSHDTMAAKIRDISLAADAEVAALTKTGKLTLDTYTAIMDKMDQLTANAIQKNLESDVSTRDHYQLLADNAKNAYDFALAHATSYTDARLLQLRAESDAAQLTLGDWQAAADAALTKTASAAGIATSAIMAMNAAMTGTVTSQFSLNPLDPASWAAKIASFGDTARLAYDSNHNPYVYIPGVNAAPPQGFAQGGIGNFGSGTLAMLHGREAVVPLPQGGSLGGQTIVQHIYVTQPLGTPQQIAAALNTAQTSRLKAIGVRLPGGN